MRTPMARITPKTLSEFNPEFCSWFVGLVDGEGSLQIKRQKGCYWLEFTISMRGDERPMLESIREELGRGNCYIHRNVSPIEHHSKTRYMFRIHNAVDTRFLVALFDRYPLRSNNYKIYKIWAEARKELDKPLSARDQDYLKHLYQAIRKARIADIPERRVR